MNTSKMIRKSCCVAIMALMCFACIPVVFLLKKAVAHKGAQHVGD